MAAISWAAGSIFARLGMQHMGAMTGTFISLITGFFLSLGVALVIDASAMLSVSVIALVWLAVLSIVQFPLGRLLNYNGIRLAGVGRSTAIMGASPLFSALLALLFLNEAITPLLLVGTLAVIGGLALVLSEKH